MSLVAVISKPNLSLALAELVQVEPLADLIEVRLDALNNASLHSLSHLTTQAKKPLIFTFRKKEEGGLRPLPEQERLAWITRLLPLKPAYFDLETSTDSAFLAKTAPLFPATKWIGSYHNFHATPQDLDSLFQTMQRPHFSLYKIAVMAQNTSDLLRLMLFTRNRPNLASISMGKYGKPSRVIAPILGSPLSYAALEEENEHLFRYNLQTLLSRFRFRSLNAQTKLYALLGDPVESSIGDIFHNERFAKEQKNAVYLKLNVPPETLGTVLPLLRELPFAGFSVTMPLKEKIVPYLDRASFQAINTICVQEGQFLGTNTDGMGALNAIEKHFPVHGKQIAILGAGGASQAIALEARLRGAQVTLYNRTKKERAFSLETFPQKAYDLLISTLPTVEEAILEKIGNIPNVMDIVYAPKMTPLLARALKNSTCVIFGEEMFVEQALLQQKAWQFRTNPKRFRALVQ